MFPRGKLGAIWRLSLVVLLSSLAVAGGALGGPAAYAHPSGLQSATLPGGTSISVSIDHPQDGAVLPLGNVTVDGTAAVGKGLPVAKTLLVYVNDVSGSTDVAGTGCGGDRNGDGASNTILDCEIAAAQTLNQEAASLGTVGEVGVAVFADSGATADMSPNTGDQLKTGPATDDNNNGTHDAEEVLGSLFSDLFGGPGGVNLFTRKSVGQFTNFHDGITNALTIVDAPTPMTNKIVVFMSDGLANTGGTVSSALAGHEGDAKFFTFAVGASSNCLSNPSGLGSLNNIASATGGTCTEVPDTSKLPDILPRVIQAQLSSLQMTVDGNPTSIATIAPALPATDPVSATYSTTVSGLTAGSHHICTTANGLDGGGTGNVQDCHTITIKAPPTVDAGPNVSGDEGSAIALSGSVTNLGGGTTTWSFAPVSGVDPGTTCSFANANQPVTTIACTDNGIFSATLTADDGVNSPVSSSTQVTVNNVPPTVGPITLSANPAPPNVPLTASASFTDPGSNDTHTAVWDWGDGSTSTGTVTESAGNGSVSDAHTYTSLGPHTITLTVKDDNGGVGTSSTQVLIFAFLGKGAFVIGDKNSASGTQTFWGAQWSKLNSLSKGPAPDTFKGFEDSLSNPTCGATWSTDPGDSPPPPAGPLPSYMAVIVSSSISQSGSTISGNTAQIVVMKTNPGYASDPGHAGTGTIVATFCK